MNKLNKAIYTKQYIKDKEGAKKRIYNNKADITGTFIALHLVDILVKYRQAKTPIQIATLKDNKIQVFPYLKLALGKAFFLYTYKVFVFKQAQEDFLYNSKHSLYGLIREPHRTINRINNNNNTYRTGLPSKYIILIITVQLNLQSSFKVNLNLLDDFIYIW